MTVHIKNFLDTCMHSNSWRFTLLKNWPNIVGKLSEKVYIEKIDRGVLTLAVTDSCWLQELYTLSPVLRTTINQTLDQPHIKQIRFKKAGYRKPKKQSSHNDISCKIKSIRLTNAEKNALACIQNEDLRSVLKAFCIRCHRERS